MGQGEAGEAESALPPASKAPAFPRRYCGRAAKKLNPVIEKVSKGEYDGGCIS